MTDGALAWGEVVKQMGLPLVTNLITLFLGIATQWAESLFTQTAKTAATMAGETARLGIVTATNKVIMAGVIGTLAGSGAMGNAALATMQVVVSTTAVVSGIGTSAVAAGAGALQAALGTGHHHRHRCAAQAFAGGGIAFGPTAGHLGEAGSAEAAIPLNARGAMFMQSAMGFGSNGTQQINVYPDRRKLTEIIVKGMPEVIHTKLGFT